MLPPSRSPSQSPSIPPHVKPYISSSSSSSSDGTEVFDLTALSRYFPFLLIIVAIIFFLVEGANPNPFDEHRRLIREHDRIMRRRQRQRAQRNSRQPQPEAQAQPGDQLGSIVCTYRVDKEKAAAGNNNGCEGIDCAICLEDFKFGDECQLFLSCNHSFHKSCIDQWLALEPHCPLCRGSVRGLVTANLDRV